MKKFLIAATLSLSLGVAGVSAFAAGSGASTKEVIETNAATNSVTLAGSFNSWNTTADPLTLNGDYWTITKTLAKDVEFKIVVNGSDWVGDGAGVHWIDDGSIGSVDGSGSNFKVNTAGKFVIKASKTIGDYGDKSYGIYFEKGKHTLTKYAVLNGGSPSKISDEQVTDRDTYAVPGKIYRSGYTCDGWYTTSACTTKYAAKSITADTNIYAKYTSHDPWTGTIHIDLRDTWYDAAANYAIMFMDKTTYTSEVTGWSTYTTGTAAGVRLINISYSLPFEPKEMTLVRYNSEYSQSSWNSQKWPTDGNKWGQTPDVSFSEVIRVGTTVVDGKNLAYIGYPKVVRWSPSASDIYLDSVKLNGSNHAEYYSTSVTFAANQEFKVQIGPYESGDYYGNYTTHASLTSSFSGGGASNIKCLKAGTYALYFDSTNNSTYITTVAIAQADEWAQYFLANVGCDATGSSLPSGWTACATEYAKLSGDAKDIVYGATAKEDGTFVEKAVARYDVAVRNHSSLSRFIVNSGNTPRAAAPRVSPIANVAMNSQSITVIIAIATVSLLAVGSYFFLRKKKEN